MILVPIEKFDKPALKGSTNNRMSDAELRNRKKWQGRSSAAGSIAGLTGLSFVTSAAILRKNPKLAQKLGVLPSTLKKKPLKRAAEKKSVALKDKGFVAGSVAGGIGGFGGLNFATIQREESHRRTGMSKSISKADPYSIYAQQQKPQGFKPKVSRSAPNPERSRTSRQQLYTPGLILGGSAAIAGSDIAGRASRSASRSVNRAANKFDASNIKRQLATLSESKASDIGDQKVLRNSARQSWKQAKKKRNRADANAAQAAKDLKKLRRLAGQQQNRKQGKRTSKLARQAAQERKHYNTEYKEWRKVARSAKRKYFDLDTNVRAAKNQYRSSSRELKNSLAATRKTVKPSKYAFKTGKYGAIGVGTGAIGLAGLNEIHRRKGGKPYRSYFDGD